MECKRCGNTDKAYFYKGHKGIYCRKCTAFKRMLLIEDVTPFDYEVSENISDFHLMYPLTRFQKEISQKCLELIKEKDVLLHCICGAGKTEIVVESIADFLRRRKKVCYAISRREVVIELCERFKKIFTDAKVIKVCGGFSDDLSGDLIICTTHQLYRYQKTFDLLIIDEVDAFPLSGNQPLFNIALNSAKGQIIFSTATVNDFLLNNLKKRNYEELTLSIRPSLKPLIVPDIFYRKGLLVFIKLFELMHKMTNQCIIFVGSKKECLILYKILKNFYRVTYVYAELADKNKHIEDFRQHKYDFIIATSILERGVTFLDIDVIILIRYKGIFEFGSIVQMLGRVGRNFKNPYGKAYILSAIKDDNILMAKEEIERANREYELYLL